MKKPIAIIILAFIVNCCKLEKIPDDLYTGQIAELKCGGVIVTGILYKDQPASNVTVQIPYSGGNGEGYQEQIVASTGVEELTATLAAGVFVDGAGSLTYVIEGIPKDIGNVVFGLVIGEESCVITIPVTVASGTVEGLNCAGLGILGSVYKDQPASNVFIKLPYSGGNGGVYGEQIFVSTGVEGLTATLAADTLVNGADTLVYEVTGIPTSVGTATFPIVFGDKSCTVSLQVGQATGAISDLDCMGALTSGVLIAGVEATNVMLEVPYSGGNGGTHGGQTVSSTGVLGLEAMVPSSSFTNGSGTLQYMIKGTAMNAGTASFELNIGGKSCTVSMEVVAGAISSLDCSEASVTGVLVAGQPVSSVVISVPYTGGNGGVHGGQVVSSVVSGVTGLTAELMSGSFLVGNGNLSYVVTGTPSGAGTASFVLNTGGQMCTYSVLVQPAVGTISSLDCSGASVTGVLVAGQVVSSVVISVPYTGGNGGVHSGQVVSSVVSGVTGLTAELMSGSFLVGNGNLSYVVTGTPSGAGTASFVLNIGGQMCTYSVLVQPAVGTISSLDCSGASVTGVLMAGQAVSGVVISVPYTGGNGGLYTAQSVMSTGVSGLTASLNGSNFENGMGIVEYNVTGIPTVSGTASFSLSLGGQSCVVSVPIQQPVPGTITALNCEAYTLSGALMPGAPVNNVTIAVPYSGGNGGLYMTQSVNSSGVAGLTASITGGVLTNGAGWLMYNLSGTPSGSGLASFELNMGGQSCVVVVPVGCGAYAEAGVWKEFGCYNLGAANTSADPFTPSWEINGGYWQWGRKLEAAAGPDGPGVLQANFGAIAGWNSSGAGNGAWLDNSKTANDPCPSGYRVPTNVQWEGVIGNNVLSHVGSWNGSPINYSSGKRIGNALLLPAAGYRFSGDGALSNRGYSGLYWSSTENGSTFAWYLLFDSGGASTYSSYGRTSGQSVRCIAE